MTIQGRTTPKWGRDRSARWDSNPENGYRTRSYPHVEPNEPQPEEPAIGWVALDGRPGYAERDIEIDRSPGFATGDLTIRLKGWYTTTLDLNERQIAFLRDTLNAWFPEESHPR
jgi:hypothetical protein